MPVSEAKAAIVGDRSHIAEGPTSDNPLSEVLTAKLPAKVSQGPVIRNELQQEAVAVALAACSPMMQYLHWPNRTTNVADLEIQGPLQTGPSTLHWKDE